MSRRKQIQRKIQDGYIYLPRKIRRYSDRLIRNRGKTKDIAKHVEERAEKGGKAFRVILNNLWRGLKE